MNIEKIVWDIAEGFGFAFKILITLKIFTKLKISWDEVFLPLVLGIVIVVIMVVIHRIIAGI